MPAQKRKKGKFDFVVSRAVMPLTDLLKIIRKNISPKQQNALPNGLICLKGRIGKRNHARQEQDYAVGPEGVL